MGRAELLALQQQMFEVRECRTRRLCRALVLFSPGCGLCCAAQGLNNGAQQGGMGGMMGGMGGMGMGGMGMSRYGMY